MYNVQDDNSSSTSLGLRDNTVDQLVPKDLPRALQMTVESTWSSNADA